MPKIARATVLEREKIVWEMRMQGATYERIAKQIGITFGGVSKILERMHARYRARNMDSIEKMKAEQIGELSRIADEAYQAWIRSKQTKVIKRKKARGVDGKLLGGYEAYEETYQQEGDPRYLQLYLKAKEDLRKITGADAPQKHKHELMGKDGKPIEINEKIQITAQEQLKEMLNKVLPPKESKEDETP